MSDPMIIEREEMARLLRASPDYLARKARQLADRHGFPRPLPGIALTWSRPLVEAWIRTNGRVAIAATANDDAPPARDRHRDMIRQQSEILAERYGVAGEAGGAR